MPEEYPADVVQALANAGKDIVQQLKEAAQKRAAEVDEIIQKYNVSFGVDEQAVRICFYVSHEKDRSARKLVVGPLCLPRLWAIAFAYYKLYNEVASAATVAAGRIANVDFVANPKLKAARDLLHWAIVTEIKVTLDQRDGKPLSDFQVCPPKGLPEPFVETGSDAKVANQLAFMAMAYILHHELAHIYREHIWLNQNLIASLKRQIKLAKEARPNMWSAGRSYKQLDQQLQHEYARYVMVEKDADTEAARWMLTDVANSDEFNKRALGITIALSWLAATDPYIGPTNNPAYPPGYDRVFQTIEKFVDNPDHQVWAVIAFILVLNLQNSGKWEDKPGGYDDFKEIANWATDIISKQSQFSRAG